MTLRRPRPRLRRSLTINAAALMVATLATNGLGLVFWALAAHLRSAEAVGRASAGVAALTLLSTIAQLNLTNVFIRLLPVAGRHGRRLVAYGYGAVLVMALGAGAVFAFTSLGHSVITGGTTARLLFIAAVPVLAFFALQDSVLTALRLTPWIPVENASFAVAKLVLLPVLAFAGGAGIVISWVIPAALAVVVVGALLFCKVFPARRELEGELPTRRRLASFIAGEYAGNICATATVQLMPLIVVWRLGPKATAYFTLPWLISMGVTTLLWNIASSFVVEAAGGQGPTHALMRRSVLMWGAVSLAAMIVCVAGAGPLLSLAGAHYAGQGATLLRLIGLSVPCYAVTAAWCSLVWLDQRVWALAGFQALSGLGVLAVTLILLPRIGLPAVGWATLSVQGASALLAGALILQRQRRGQLVTA